MKYQLKVSWPVGTTVPEWYVGMDRLSYVSPNPEDRITQETFIANGWVSRYIEYEEDRAVKFDDRVEVYNIYNTLEAAQTRQAHWLTIPDCMGTELIERPDL
jgi:hypothetical protein